MKRAIVAARIELETVKVAYKNLGWSSCVGSSGTILSIEEILQAEDSSTRGITAKGLEELTRAVTSKGHADELDFASLKLDRRLVLPGGLAVLNAVFEAFSIDTMTTSKGALREGLLYDLLGSVGHEDVRERTVHAFARRYRADLDQAARVEQTAALLMRDVAEGWNLNGEATRFLRWAARLHEVGLTVSYTKHHVHGAYLIDHSDLPGFSEPGRSLLALLVRTHRRKITSDFFEPLGGERSRRALRLVLLLRLAVRLHRSRGAITLPPLVLSESDSLLRLAFPAGWLDSHPLTVADLQAEALLLRAVNVRLEIV